MKTKHEYEAMDLFYLGREINQASNNTSSTPLLYKNKNLTTHAAIIGMTGSGKTGLGIGLLEEAAIDKIPAIVIDPKGDMGNLLLSFPDLASDDFLPWVDSDSAARKEISKEEMAEQTARSWRKGLAGWDQDGQRIRRMRDNAEFTIYTPGSSAGQQVSVLDSFEAPDSDVLDDNDTLTGLVNSSVSSLLALVGIEADPLQSREHILLSSVILHHWRQGQDLDLQSLIRAVVDPPFDEVGAFPLKFFFPQDKRMNLAMQLNNILASPSFSTWTEGQSLRIENFLVTPDGKAKVSIFSIAHLSDKERMFFVTMLLGRLISWMRRQEGASGLRCLLYMDEIFGYFPPVGNPPSKEPMLLLLKQARAFGIGVVLSTQNPVDLDYKGMSNIGTWFIGRLQTRQDQDRVLAGITNGGDRAETKQIRNLLSNMRGRTFLMRSTHLDAPVLFETRWVLSYLKGPVSLLEIERLNDSDLQNTETNHKEPVMPEQPVGTNSGNSHPPMLAGSIDQYFVPAPIPVQEMLLIPFLYATATVRFFNQRRNIDQQQKVSMRLDLNTDTYEPAWQDGVECNLDLTNAANNSPENVSFGGLPQEFSTMKNLNGPKKAFQEFLYRGMKLPLFKVSSLKLESHSGESKEQFILRIRNVLTEKKYNEAGKLEEQFRKKEQQLENRLYRANTRLEKEQEDVSSKTMDTIASFGMAALSAFLGKKSMSISTASRTTRGVRGVGRIAKEKGDVKQAREAVFRIEQEMNGLAEDLQTKLTALHNKYGLHHYPVDNFSITPRRTDVFDVQIALVWQPLFELSDTSFSDVVNLPGI